MAKHKSCGPRTRSKSTLRDLAGGSSYLPVLLQWIIGRYQLSTHTESFVVFVVIGLLLGAITSILHLFGQDGSAVVDIATEALSLRIFSILAIISLLGLTLISLSKTPSKLKKYLVFVSMPSLRAGLSTGFIAGGMMAGVGLGGFLVFVVAGSHKQTLEAFGTLLLGGLLLLYVWPISYLAAELLGVTTHSMKIVASIYSIGSAALFFLVAPFGIWSKLLIIVLLVGLIFTLKAIGSRAQRGAQPDRLNR